MKDVLRTRLEFVLAKLAGRDVDISTLTPNAPASMTEKLILEAAERIDNAAEGGSGGTIIVETEWVDEGKYDKYHKTVIPADDIITAFISGKRILFHTSEVEGFAFCESYLQLMNYLYPFDDGQVQIDEYFELYHDHSPINTVIRTSDGYLGLKPYLD